MIKGYSECTYDKKDRSHTSLRDDEMPSIASELPKPSLTYSLHCNPPSISFLD